MNYQEMFPIAVQDMRLASGITATVCPLCGHSFTALALLTREASARGVNIAGRTVVDDSAVLGWAASCGCLISASKFRMTMSETSSIGTTGHARQQTVTFARLPVMRSTRGKAGTDEPQ